jgi:hypothetical protein
MLPHSDVQRAYDCPILIKQKLLDKRRLRRNWHRLRTTESSFPITKATSKPFYKTSHPRLPLTILSRRLPRESRRPQILPSRFSTRNMGANKHRKSTNIRRTPGIHFPATSLSERPGRRRTPYSRIGKSWSTRTSTSPLQTIWSTSRHQQLWS